MARVTRRWAVAILAAAAIAIAGAPGGAAAGGFSDGEPAGALSPEAIVRSAKKVEHALAARGARVALVFRTGRPRKDLPDGVSYTHGAFWVYAPIMTEEGLSRGYAVYNLYSVGEGRSDLAQDFPVDFIAGVLEPDVGVVVPSLELQRRIYELIFSPAYDALHNPAYSLISNPHDPRYQNCNEFLLDVIAAAAWETTDRRRIKANLAAHFDPQRLDVGPLARAFAPLADPQIRMDDQAGPLRTTTFAAMARFLEAFDLAQERFVIRMDIDE